MCVRARALGDSFLYVGAISDSDGDTKMGDAGAKKASDPPPDAKAIEETIEKRLDFVKKAADKMMHIESQAAGGGAGPEKGKGKRGRMSEKAEDDILIKRAETEASGKNVYAGVSKSVRVHFS